MANRAAQERVGHNICKFAAHPAPRDAVRQSGLPCQVLGDRVVVSVDDSDFEPDVVLHCGERLPRSAIAVPEPLVIVEVLSPTTSGIDRSLKLREHFRLPSLCHYLLVWPDEPRIVLHSRSAGGEIEAVVFTCGNIRLDPPGVAILLEAFYEE
jgi:Uma2 family endonuclease